MISLQPLPRSNPYHHQLAVILFIVSKGCHEWLVVLQLMWVFCAIYSFSELTRESLTISNSAAGVLAHLVADGPSCWIVDNPTRETVRNKLRDTVNGWDLESRRNVRYRYLMCSLQNSSCVTAVVKIYMVFQIAHKHCSWAAKIGIHVFHSKKKNHMYFSQVVCADVDSVFCLWHSRIATLGNLGSLQHDG